MNPQLQEKGKEAQNEALKKSSTLENVPVEAEQTRKDVEQVEKMPQTKDLLAQARTQIAEEIKMLKEQKTNGDIADDAYALRVNTLYESAKQLYELKQRMEEEKQKTTHETSVQYINHKYDISRYTEVKKTQRKLFDLVQDNRKMREKDVKELNKITNEFRSVGNLNQIQVTELKKKMTELVSRYKGIETPKLSAIDEQHPLKSLSVAYFAAKEALAKTELYATKELKTNVKNVDDKGEKIEQTGIESLDDKFSYLSDIDGSGSITAYNKKEKHFWTKDDDKKQEKIFGEQQLYRGLSEQFGEEKDDKKLQELIKRITGKEVKNWKDPKEMLSVRKEFIDKLELRVSSYAILASSLLAVGKKEMVANGLMAVIANREDEYRSEIITLATEKPEVLKKRLLDFEAQLPASERKGFWEKIGSALTRIGLGFILPPLHIAVQKRTLDSRGLVADAGGNDVTAKALIRGILPEVEVSIESQNQVFKLSDDWGKLLVKSFNEKDFSLNIASDNKDLKDIANRIHTFFEKNKKLPKDPVATEKEILEYLLKNVSEMNQILTKDKTSLTTESLRKNYVIGLCSSARNSLGVELATAMRDPVKWSPMIGAGAGVLGWFVDVAKREKTEAKRSAGINGEALTSGAEQNATYDSKDLATYFKIIKTKKPNGEYEYVFTKGQKGDTLFSQYPGIKKKDGVKTITSRVPLMFRETTNISANSLIRELQIREMNEKERKEHDDRELAAISAKNLSTSIEGLKATQGTTSEVGEIDLIKAKLKTEIKVIKDVMGTVGTTEIRLNFKKLQNTIRDAFQAGNPNGAFAQLVAFKYQGKQLFSSLSNITDSVQKNILLVEFLKETAGDWRIRSHNKKTKLSILEGDAWGGKIDTAFDRRIKEMKGMKDYNPEILRQARKDIDEGIRSLTEIKGSPIENAMSFVNFSQVLRNKDGKIIDRTFRGVVPMAGSIDVVGKPQDLKDEKLRNALIDQIPEFVLEFWRKQINEQIATRNKAIQKFNIDAEKANEHLPKEKRVSLLKELTLLEISQMKGLLRGESAEASGIKNLNYNFQYARFDRCLNDTYIISKIIPQFGDIPGIPSEPPKELKTKSVSESGKSTSASVGTLDVEETATKLGAGTTYGKSMAESFHHPLSYTKVDKGAGGSDATKTTQNDF